jgi:hypothetical protein
LQPVIEAYAKEYADYPVSLEYPTVSLANFGDQSDISSMRPTGLGLSGRASSTWPRGMLGCAFSIAVSASRR